MIGIKDIDIFVMTHNRANYLLESVNSLLCNTLKPDFITILDNESTDNTAEVVATLGDNIRYIRTYGFLGNFKKARDIVSRPYIMLFHDDDILHFQYFENVIKLLNFYKNVSLITSRYTEFYNNNVPQIKNCLKLDHFLFKNIKEWSEHMYYVERIAYATAIYKTTSFLNEQLEYSKFNKFNDWPFMCKMAKHGQVVLLDDVSAFFVRRHDTQDTFSMKNVPSLEQIVNWDLFFGDAMDINSENISEYLLFEAQSRRFSTGKFNTFLPDCEKTKNNWSKLQDIRKNKLGICIDDENLVLTENEYVAILQKKISSLYGKLINKNYTYYIWNNLFFYIKFNISRLFYKLIPFFKK